MSHPSWLPDESTLVACANLVLLAISVLLWMRAEYWKEQSATADLTCQRRVRRASRKLLIAKRRAKGLQYALNVTVNQYHSLRRRFDRHRPQGSVVTAPHVRIEPPARKMIVPPPLDLATPVGDDPTSWCDSGLYTGLQLHHPIRPDDTQTRPIHPDAELLRQSRPPAAPRALSPQK